MTISSSPMRPEHSNYGFAVCCRRRRILRVSKPWRVVFYANLERRSQPARVEQLLEGEVREGDWHARNPLAARCGVIDYYWLARLLRAEVSPRGGVRYVDRSWLSYLPGLASRPEDAGTPPFDAREMRRIEAILRSAFDF